MASDKREGDLNVPLILVIGVASCVWLALVVLFARAYVFHQKNVLWEENVAKVEDSTLVEYRQSEQDNMSDYHWVDLEKKTLTIPMDEAMERYLASLNKTRTADAGPVE